MKGLFSYDSALFRAFDKLGSLFILNMLTLICSIPLFTIGSAFTALYYVTMKMVKDEETYVTKDYLRSLKQNFIQGLIIWLILFAVGALLLFDYRLMSVNKEILPVARVFMIVALSCLIFWVVELAYVFPVLAKFYNTVPQTMRNAFLMGIRHFPKTIAIIFINLAFPTITAIGLYKNGKSFLAPLYICLGFSVTAYANSFIFIKIFDQYITSDENGDDESEGEYVPKLEKGSEEA